ncbi:flagellar protein MotY [Methylophaga sp. OBS4]|uniref:flagellar protein MotY n=1 Tax=Methylophaga sp. OBS4 TaxID=2991935 RepID=UPI0022557E2D|nr:OmpA family protein [Methylophaga sp. OBS4]MCX4188067.1 OmpA family protein [Methylophaga sp. OBS4]
MLLSTLLTVFLSTPVFAEQFQAPVTDTRWQIIESPLECSLMQPIPGFGEAGFYRRNGGPLMLTFSTFSQPAEQTHVQFEIAAAPWQNSEAHTSLTSISTQKGQKKFTIDGLYAQQALTHLQEGRFPVIRYRPQTSMSEISVMLSTIHLSDSLPAFQQCLSNLYPDTFNEVQYLTVYFDLEKSEIDAAAQKALTRLANYVKVDDSIQEIRVTSHTDNHGRLRLNEPLSDARAMAIKDFLVQCEVPEQLINTQSFVDRKPIVSNKTQMGRAQNRRAEITLIR